MKCIIAGSGSDIAQGLREHLLADGWEVETAKGHERVVPQCKWDMLILCHGQLDPIGKFFECDSEEWADAILVNAMFPLISLRLAWPNRNPNAYVVFLGGPNMLRPNPTYTAYRAGKAMLEALVGTLADEYPEAQFRLLHPGTVNTKIHAQTLKAGKRAANYERVFKIVNGMETTTSHDEVYQRLKSIL